MSGMAEIPDDIGTEAREIAGWLTSPESPSDFEVGWVAEALFAERQAQWRPIETAPRDGTPILLYCPLRFGMERWQVRYWTGQVAPGWVNANNAAIPPYEPTHWTPLSAPQL